MCSNCNNNDGDDASKVEPLSQRAIAGWLELGCWTMVALAPLLYWANGPAVSTDQLVVRSGLVGFALGGGLALRLAACLRGGSSPAQQGSASAREAQSAERETKS